MSIKIIGIMMFCKHLQLIELCNIDEKLFKNLLI